MLDSEKLGDDIRFHRANVSSSRFFAQTYHYGYSQTNPYGKHSVLVVGDIANNAIDHALHDLPADLYMRAEVAQDERLILTSSSTKGVYVLDASDMTNITFEHKDDVASSHVYDVTLDGDRALCALGPYGLGSVNLQ